MGGSPILLATFVLILGLAALIYLVSRSIRSELKKQSLASRLHFVFILCSVGLILSSLFFLYTFPPPLELQSTRSRAEYTLRLISAAQKNFFQRNDRYAQTFTELGFREDKIKGYFYYTYFMNGSVLYYSPYAATREGYPYKFPGFLKMEKQVAYAVLDFGHWHDVLSIDYAGKMNTIYSNIQFKYLPLSIISRSRNRTEHALRAIARAQADFMKKNGKFAESIFELGFNSDDLKGPLCYSYFMNDSTLYYQPCAELQPGYPYGFPPFLSRDQNSVCAVLDLDKIKDVLCMDFDGNMNILYSTIKPYVKFLFGANQPVIFQASFDNSDNPEAKPR